jgi:hypothetical protein
LSFWVRSEEVSMTGHKQTPRRTNQLIVGSYKRRRNGFRSGFSCHHTSSELFGWVPEAAHVLGCSGDYDLGRGALGFRDWQNASGTEKAVALIMRGRDDGKVAPLLRRRKVWCFEDVDRAQGDRFWRVKRCSLAYIL